jgi:phage terminase small subunit
MGIKTPNKNGLTQNQEIFCQEYVKTGVIARALEAANYKKPSSGSRLLKRSDIQKRITDLNNLIANEKIAKTEEILIFLSETMRNKQKKDKDRIKSAEILCKCKHLFEVKISNENKDRIIIVDNISEIDEKSG